MSEAFITFSRLLLQHTVQQLWRNAQSVIRGKPELKLCAHLSIRPAYGW